MQEKARLPPSKPIWPGNCHKDGEGNACNLQQKPDKGWRGGQKKSVFSMTWGVTLCTFLPRQQKQFLIIPGSPSLLLLDNFARLFFPQQYTVSKQIVACRNCLKYPLTKACLFASIPVNLEGFCCSAVKQICPLSSPRETAICARNRTNVLCSERTNVLCSQLCSIT